MTRRARIGGLAVLAIAVTVFGVLCWLLFRMAVVVDTLPPAVGIGTNAEYSRLEGAAVALGWGFLGLGAATGAGTLLRTRQAGRSGPAPDRR
jgi:hypothetical protein